MPSIAGLIAKFGALLKTSNWAGGVLPGTAEYGDLKLTACGSPSAGWVTCNGAALSRTTYAQLFANIGTSFGVGDGTTTFNIPDFRGRTPIGVGTGTSLTARAIGAKVGTEAETLTAAQIPAHTHPVGRVGDTNPAGFTDNGTGAAADRMVATTGSADVNGPDLWQAKANTGGGGSHNNMQPSLACNVFIYVGA